MARTITTTAAFAAPRFTLAALAGLAGVWMQRLQERRTLATLDDRLLADIGVSRADAELEMSKPFWRD